MKHPDDGKTQPVIIYRQGHPTQAALMNEKAFNKTTERGELWTLHPETGRLVPAEVAGTFRSLKRENGWFVAELDAPESEVALGEGTLQAEASRTGADNAAPAVADGSPAENTAVPGPPAGGGVLQDLQALIDRRREELPEGSYTTHLFTKGVEKIRKKTGEEAVELILARAKEELLYESADFLYHLMVLLSAEGLSIEDVLDELRKRHG